MEDYEYDFAYECRRLVEAMAPRSARTFRQEFNMQDLATTEHTYTTHYTTEKYVRTSHSSEVDGTPIKSMTNGKLNSPKYTTKTTISDDRPDIRNLKRVHKMYEGPNIIESRGIIHPETKEVLTVGQAISMRILDVRTGRLLSSSTTKQTMTIEQAAKEGLIDPKLAARLTGPCGMTEDGNEVTLLEAIQRELYDAEQGLADPAEKRIKVTVEGQLPDQGMSISDALNRGQVDLQKGLYRLPNGSFITIAEAYQRGFLIYTEIIKIKSSALSLSDAISQELIDNSGWILDRNSGDRFQLEVAIKNELINPNVREIVDPKNDTKITLAEAIEKNIINTKHSKYVHPITKEKFSFKDAASKRYISKPMTLKDVCDHSLMTNDGKILTPINKAPLNILEAISVGILDSDNIKCVTDTTTGQLITLSEALGSRIILTDNKFRDNLTGEICTIPEAVDRGLITSVSQRSIFDIDGFRDPKTGEFVSFNIALSRGNLKYVNGETFLKSESGDFVFLEDCPKVSIVRPEVLEMFMRKIGVVEMGKELNVLDAVFKNVLDPKSGYLLDSATKKPIPFNKAVEIGLITPEGAALLNSLLNITLTLQTVTKTVKRYVTVTNTNTTHRSETIITFAEAIRRGLIDETTQTFTDPTTGTVFPIQQALDEGLLGIDPNESRVARISDRVSKKDLVPGQVVELKITKKSFIKDLPPSPESKLQYENRPETVKSPDVVKTNEEITRQIKTVTTKSLTDPLVTAMTIKKNTIELPQGGWTLKEAIQQNLFDPTTGMFTIPGTDRILDLQEAVSLKIINPNSAHVIDFKTKKEIPLIKALEFRILDNTGHYKHNDIFLSMKEAIERNIVIFITLSESTASQKVITITSISGMPDKMEITDIEKAHSPILTSEDQSVLEPVQVVPGIIYDPATALVISTTSGISQNIIEAVDVGAIPSDRVNVVDPINGQQINLKVALERGIVDKQTGNYKESSGKRISLVDAAKVGLIAVVGSPLVAASKIIQVIKNTMVIDPTTGEELPMEVAYERGLVDEITYKNYEDSIRSKTPESENHKPTSTIPAPKTLRSTMIVDPTNGDKISIEEAKSRGLIDSEENVTRTLLDQRKPGPSKTSSKTSSIEAAVSEGFITVESIQNSLSADNKKTMDNVFLQKASSPVNTVVLHESQIPEKPKYNINKLQKENKTPSCESKPLILQKLRKQVVMPSEGVSMGLVDRDTADLLNKITSYKDENGAQLTLGKAIEIGLIDENKGKILDPQHGEFVSIKEAIVRGLLDSEGLNEILIPIAKKLSIPEVLEQGLLDVNTGKIIHPETGSLLTLREAIICDIVDPMSVINIAPGHSVRLAEAISNNIIDSEKNIIKTDKQPLDLLSAVNANIFNEKLDECKNIPPAGMTLSVAIKNSVIDPKTGKVKHPLTGERISINEAIKRGFLMDIPYPQSSSTITLEDAIKNNVVDLKDGTFTDIKTKEKMPVEKAMEQGLLALKKDSSLSSRDGIVTTVTETFTSQHTITTKMVELLANYVLINANEVQNTITGEIMTIDAARSKGIIRDEQTSKEEFLTSDTSMTFEDALNLGYINIDNGTFTNPTTGEVISITEAINSGVLNTESPSKPSEKSQPKDNKVELLDLKEAFDLLFDENTQKFYDPKSPDSKITFKEALEKKIIDPESVIYDVTAGKPVTLQEALNTGLLDKKSGKFREPETGKSVDIKNAAKMGLVAVIAGPVLAGMAVAEGVKNIKSKITKLQQNDKQESALRKDKDDPNVKFIEVERKNNSSIEHQVPQSKAMVEKASDVTKSAIDCKEPSVSQKEVIKKPFNEEPSDKDISESKNNQLPKSDLIKRDSDLLIETQKEEPLKEHGYENITPTTSQSTAHSKEKEHKQLIVKKNEDKSAEEPTQTALQKDSSVKEEIIANKPDIIKTREMLPSEKSDTVTNFKDRNTKQDQENIQEFHQITPDGQQVTTIVKTTISKSDPTVSTSEETTFVSEKVSKITTIEVTQNTSTTTHGITDINDHLNQKKNKIDIHQDQVDKVSKVSKDNQPEMQIFSTDITSSVSPKSNESTVKSLKEEKSESDALPATPSGSISNTNLVDNTEQYKDILSAIDEGAIAQETILVTDYKSGRQINMKEAVDKGIINVNTLEIENKDGNKITFADAAKIGLVAIVGAPILAASKAVEGVKKALTIDNNSPEKINLDKSSTSTTTPKSSLRHPKDVAIIETTQRQPIISGIHQENKQPIVNADEKTMSKLLIDAEKQPLRAIDEITEQNTVKARIEPDKVLYENIPLIDAIAEGKIEPKVCRIIMNGEELALTVQDSLEQEQISRFTPVDVVSKNCVIVRDIQPKYSLSVSQKLSPEELSEMGVYDIEKQIFLNPRTGAKISFEELVYSLNVFDPSSILVKDLSCASDNYVPFDEAISRPIIDKVTGHMVNPKTGKRVSFLECVQIGWVVEKPEDTFITKQITVESALEKGLYDPKTKQLKDVNTGDLVSMSEAIQKGIIDNESLLIKLPHSNEIISLSDAIEQGILEMRNGTIIIIETQETIEISVAIQQGIITISRRPISIEAVINKNMYEPTSGKIKDNITEQLVALHDAVERNIVHPTISEIKDTALEKYVPLSEALDTKLINPETGKLIDKKTGKHIPLDDALKRGFIATKSITFSLLDVIELGYYSPESCRVLNPANGEITTLAKAIENKLIDPTDIKIKNDNTETVIPFDEAVKSGLLDLEQGVITSPRFNLKDALDKGYLLSDKKPWSLQEGLVQGVYDPETGLLTINGKNMTLDDAIKKGNINPEVLTVKNSVTGEMISLADAIESGIIDSKEGVVRDPVHGDKISLTDASERGLILPAKRKLSLPEAVFKGFYDPNTGKFSNPQTKDKMPTERAIRKRLLDPQSTLVHVGGKVIPFEFAVDKGIVDGRTGTILIGNERIDFREAFERGILVEVRRPLSLMEAIEKGVYNEITGLFMDPQSGKKYSLAEAIKLNLIDPNSVHIQDNRSGKWSKITLSEFMDTGMLDDKTGKIKNINNENEEISLAKALEIGLLIDSKAPISLQRALHQGLYDDTTGKIIDPVTSRKITLHEAIRRSIISPKYLCYFYKKSEKPLTLAQCCQIKVIDKTNGKFIEPGSDAQVSLSEALSLGLIVDIESAGFSLYDALAMNMYDITELTFIHPVTERKLSLKNAISEELINPETSLVKHIPSSKYMKLAEAIEAGVIDENNSAYILPNGNTVNLVDAKHRGLIVTSKKNLSLEEIIKNGLFRADNGKIVDPSSNEFVTIDKAIENNLIDPNLTLVKDGSTGKFKPLIYAIRDGDVDVIKGRVLDTKAKKTYSIDKAFDKGLLVTVIPPLTSQRVTKQYVPDSSDSKEPVLREFTLDEAIKYEFIDPNTCLIKDPHKNKYIPLKLAITEGIIDKNAKGLFDTQNRSRMRCFTFENCLIVYTREPLTFEQAIENGYLNINTARFTDPQSNEVFTIKDAATLGYIDSDTALIKDNLKKRLVKLPEAFRKGLMDAEKGNILDTETSKLNSLSAAIESGLLMTPKKSFTLIETLNFGIYNPTTGALNDPFITTSVIDRKRLTLGEAIRQGIVDPSSTVVKEPETGKICPLVQAIEQQLVNPIEGRIVIDPKKGISLDLVKALKKGYLLPAETRQAVEEKYRLCDESLSKLLEWIAVVEERLANQEAVREDMDELRNQINVLKLIKDDLETHQRQVSACADQAKQLLVSGGDVLAPHEVAALERGVRQLKQRCDKCSERCDKMLRRMIAARDELGKFTNELNTFNSWMESAYRTLEDKEVALSKVENLTGQSDDVREFVSDVIAHQADLRFITMAAQKFVDESKEFLSLLNDYRTSLPARLSHVAPPVDSIVREHAALARRRHSDLANRAQRLLDRLRTASDGSARYREALQRAQRWIQTVEPQVQSCVSETAGGDPRALDTQLTRVKALHSELRAQGRLVDHAHDACEQLVKSLEGNLTPAEIRQLEIPVVELNDRYNELDNALGAKCSELEAALLQCQGLQDAAETQAQWLSTVESSFKNQSKPASLIRERLDEQVREQRSSHSELEARRPTLNKLLATARDAATTPSNARIAKKLEQRAEDICARYDKLLERSAKRGVHLEEVSAELTRFTQAAATLEAARTQLGDDLRDGKITDILANRDKQMPLLEECLRNGKQLISKPDVTDTHVVRDRMKALENQWRDFNVMLEEKQKLSKQKADQLNQYESLRMQVLEWLQNMEHRVNHLRPVAVDLEVIKQQQDELRPLAKEYRDFSVNIDKVNESGALYEALSRGERADSPHRKRSLYSPTKRHTPSRSDGRSPSPVKSRTLVSPASASSGFSSRRSSQDGFHLDELSPVQQQVSEINNRYELLGTKLADRQTELDAVKEEVRKHYDSLRQLNNFLDKVQRQLPKESVPNTKEEADKTIKQARAALEEMYEKQSILDSTKTQVRELIRRKQSVEGADRLNDEAEETAARWKALHDAFKDKIHVMEEMKDFHDTHSSLTQWLGSKERMMAALGPISSDSRVVHTQVQQVQVLREEFRSQQPQLSHLEQVAASVLQRLDPHQHDAQKLEAKLRQLQERWNDLLSQLEHRAESLGAAADTSRELDAGLARLKNALHAIGDKLDDVTEHDPHDQLREVENLERQLEGQRPLLADLEAAGAALADVLADPGSRQDIQGKLAAVARQYDNLQRKLDNKKAEIEAALKDGRNLEASVSRTLGWLQSSLGGLPSRLLVSADRPTLQHQLDQHEPLYRDLTQREHEIIMLIDKGREMEKKPAHQNLRKDLDRIQTQWDKLKREIIDRQTRLQTAMEHCRKYSKAQESFVPWLVEVEERLATRPPLALTKKDVERQLKELQQIRNDVWKRSGEYENNRTLGETLISACDVDQDVVRRQLDTMKERWDRINNEVLQQVEYLESTARKLGEFLERVRAVEAPLARCEERLETALSAPPAAARDQVARLADHVHALRAPLQSINIAADDIVALAMENGGEEAGARARQVLEETAKNLAERLQDLEKRTDDARDKLAGAAAAYSQFQDKVKNVSHDISDLEKELDAMKAPGREIKTVKAQLDDLARYYKRLELADDLVAESAKAAEALVDSGFAESAKARDQVESIRKQLAKLDERARAKEQDLDDTLSKLEAFYKAYDSVMDDVDEATEQVRSLKPVSSEVEHIRAQQKDFAELKKHTLEPLGLNVTHCNRIGQGLVRSALQGASTGQLEKDLEKMNDKWNALKDKMNERERRLDVGLLQSGKFAEALAGLEKWLADTEDMVNNQKSPSADYKVVKAQLQEQKFLKKMLMDRQNSMSSLFAMGNEVAAGCDPAERKAIEKQLKGLMQRFDDLTTGAQQRMLDLEQAMKVAKLFQEQLQPLLEWLGTTERKVKALELVPTDEEKIQQKIREHKVLHEDILSRRPQFSQLTDTASQLLSLVGDDEAAALADRLQAATDRYQALVDHSLNIGSLLDSSRKGLRHLVLTYQELSLWMDGMEQLLARRRLLPVHMEELLRQMDELAEKTEEIAAKQEAVDSTVESGLELMKHISGDEALQLKDKLDALQRRYNDLTSKGADLLRIASETLPLVQQLYNSHNKLSDWLSSAETCLQSVDPREEDILRLEAELQEFRPLLDNINLVGPQLCQISPGEGAAHVEGVVTRDNRRFDAVAEQVQRKAERLLLSKKRSLEVVGDMEEVIEWLRGADSMLRSAEPPAGDAAALRAQLAQQRPLSDDVAAQRARARDLLGQAKKVLRECQSSDEAAIIRERSDELKEMMEEVAALSAARLAALEQALPLAEHFADTHNGLSAWLDEMEKQVSSLALPALRPDHIAQQQDKNEMLQQSIAGHKPLVDKLIKTGEALSKLCGEEDAAKIQDTVEHDCDRYNAIRAELRQRQQELEQALQESAVFAERLEGMVRALSGAAEQLRTAEPVSAHPHRIIEQMDENNALIEDLDKRQEAYRAVTRAASDVMAKASNSDPAVRDIRAKLDKLNKLWAEVQKSSSERGHSLESALEMARKFWQQLDTVMSALADLADSLAAQPPPAAQPADIQAQQVALQEIRHEIDHTKPEVEKVRKSGSSLMSICGEPDKPEVKKHMEELDSAWDNITALYARREENLIDAMEKAMEFHDTLQNLNSFLDTAEDKFSRMGPLGSDIDAVKRQIAQLAAFKQEVDPHMVKVEALNRSLMRQAGELTERTSPEQAASIRQPLSAVNARWAALLRGMVERHQQLERALLRLGQLQHALRDTLQWIQHTSDTLDTLAPVAGDPQALEVELAKLKVLVNDIAAHQASVDTLNEAAATLMHQADGSDEAGETAEKLTLLNKKWRELQQKARDRQAELEDALREAQSFNLEIGDLLSWAVEVDAAIAASRPVGGLPETAAEQLDRFMEIYNEVEANRPKVEAVLQQGQEYIKRQAKPNPTSQLHLSLKNLKTRWDNVTSRASDKKIKLEIALKEATEFHEALQAFVDWLTSAEKTLTSAKPVSRVMETLLGQVEEHKLFQKEVSTHRETMLQLDKKGTHLKYFSQKQDVILIKNLLVSVQHRWERVVARAAERTRALDHGLKEAREFNDLWNNMMSWLEETDKQLDQLNSETAVNDPEKIKLRLNKHREFQKALAAKQPVYDQTTKVGKQLKDKAPKTDEPVLKNMLTELKTKWTTVCSKAVDRQRRLEEALLYSGQFKDAMSALLDWLKKRQATLSADQPLHGDLDTVMALIEQHKQFEEDLHSREQQMQSVLKTGRDLEATVPPEDAQNIKLQCSELTSAWDSVVSLAEKKASRLEAALKEAERLHKSVNLLLEWLSDAESRLRFSGQLSEAEHDAQQQLADHERFSAELKDKQRDKDDTIALAHSILAKAHPDAVSVIKHWITIIQSRWDEVWQWSIQRGNKLAAHARSLRDLDLVLDELLQWLAGLEGTLRALETEPLPESIELLEGLIDDHKDLMEHTQKRQQEVDRVCKAYQVKSQSQGRETTPRKISAKTAIRGTPSRGSQHDLHRDRSASPDYYGTRRYSRASPGRESPERLPHYGPRFPPKGSKGSEPEFRSPRVKQLWDRWRNVWLMAWERQRRLHERLAHLRELQRVSNFSWDEWRKQFLKFMNHKKSRLTDLFRKMDKDNNGLIPRNEFIDGILNTKFDTSRLEMGAVADLFDRNGSGLIDWEEFIAALRPDWVERRGPPTDADKIHDEVKRLVMLCTCRQKFRVFQVGEGKYRFGDSQKLRLVRILRSTVMVRVGGGWVALDEFLVKNDPCRAEEFMEQLRPIFEALRQREELPCSYPLHVGSTHGTKQAFIYGHSRSQGSTTPGGHHYTHHHGYQPSPGYHWVRERTVRSVPMSSGPAAGRASRSSLSAGTPDSLSDNEAASGLGQRYRKPSVPRSTLTPGGSRPGSRPGSRTGSKPPSRHGSNLSLDSTDEVLTPSRIPMRKVTNTRASLARAAATASKLGTANGASRPRTPTGALTPASRYGGTMYRTSSIPTLSPAPAIVSSTHSQPSSLASEHPKSLSHTHPAYQTQGTTRIPIYVGSRSQRTPSVERRTKSHKSHSRETSQDPSPISHDPKSDQRSPEDDSSLFSISGMTSDNEYESNISESSGDASKPTQRDIKGSGSFASTDGHTPARSRIPVPKDSNHSHSRQRTPSGSSTPVRPGTQTAASRLVRRPSDAENAAPTTPATPLSRRTPARTTEKREPFRL
ncbi:dystonin isoform X15 [Danaus plexippus]|uniref:dystonin isoform X15 n=1 Tax=Danaus plexippus TaxID=13037 RepID=UPI002AB13CA5|nr:dystonin isoform X15 [Danaus plexippus]